ncbi:MAG: hypothetical protein IVW55_01600 [Chloroflexi bacterium]|nr:hypothetical protein [Chloroflexota bacterium]
MTNSIATRHNTRPSLVVFQGGVPEAATSLERLIIEAQIAATLDLLAMAAGANAFNQAILVTEETGLQQAALSDAAGWPTSIPFSIEQQAGESFHFGETLRAICRSYRLERVVYVGGGAAPLATRRDIVDLALAVSGDGECVASNNLYSADMVAFHPASALARIAPPPTDNDLAWLLHFKAGLPYAAMPRSLATQFDIDTPTDLAALWWATQSPPLGGVLGPRITALLPQAPLAIPLLARRVEESYRVMSTRRAEVLVAGRVSSWVWKRLETNLPCQTRIVSEERGMRASGREARGEVRSLLGLFTDRAGTAELMDALGHICDAAFLDSRVLFAHRRLNVSRPDRFASDALVPEEVSDPWVRQLTEAAATATVPVVLGGHSLVSGGIWALSERVRGSASAA